MADIEFTNCGPKLVAKQLKALETQLGCELPEDYREFLLKHNGGDPDKKCFYASRGDAETTWVDFFHQVDEHLGGSCEEAEPCSIAFERFAYGEVTPDDCLIIGKAARDDLLLLRIRGKRRGQIDLKNMEELGPPLADSDWGADKEQGVRPVAKSFSAFLKMLQREE
jgi:hypothetical protein